MVFIKELENDFGNLDSSTTHQNIFELQVMVAYVFLETSMPEAHERMENMYYEHGKSGEFFRSMVEVVNFMMYEICPRHFVKSARGTPIVEPSGTKGKKRSRLSSRISYNDEEGEMKTAITQEEAVKAFLKEAYENLQNLFKNENHRESSSKVARSED